MAAHAPTKTYSRAVSANLEFQRQLGVRQNSLESKKRHARCDLNTQIITLRETLFNIRARTPTILSDEFESGSPSPTCRSRESLGAASPGRGGESSGRVASRNGVDPSAVSLPNAIPDGVRRSPRGETLIPSQNGLVATGPRTFKRIDRQKVARRVVHVSVGPVAPASDKPEPISPRTAKQKIDVRFVPAGKPAPCATTTAPEMLHNGSRAEEASPRPDVTSTPRTLTPSESQPPTKASSRRVLFSAHPGKRSRRALTPSASPAGAGDAAASPDGAESPIVDEAVPKRPMTSLGKLVSAPKRPNTGVVNEETEEKGERGGGVEGAGQHPNDTTTTSSELVLGRGSRASTIITPRPTGPEGRRNSESPSLVAAVHPSNKARISEDCPTSSQQLSPAKHRNFAGLRPPARSRSKTFFLVRNPFFKLDPSTEKRIDQVEAIRLSLEGLYQRRIEKKLADEKEREERLAAEKREKEEQQAGLRKKEALKAREKGTPSPDGGLGSRSESISTLRIDSASSKAGTIGSPRPKSGLTVKVKLSPARTSSSRYTVHQAGQGPLAIPGVSSNQLRDLEKFHVLMKRQRSSVKDIGHFQ